MQTLSQTGEGRAARLSSKSARTHGATQTSGRRANALSLLRQDHEKVSALFEKYEKGMRRMGESAKQKLAEQICRELTVHARIEEEVFYPQVEESVKGMADMLAEARVEHETLKRLIADIHGGTPGDKKYDACVQVLAEYTKHHVREEHNEMFPKVRKSKLDLAAVGEELMRRKQELLDQAEAT